MHIHWDQLLAALGCKITGGKDVEHTCPLHPRARKSLTVFEGKFSTQFTCSSFSCAFQHGDAIKLVATARHITPSQAAHLFTPGQELHYTTVTSGSQAEEYYTDSNSQEYILNYLKACHDSLITKDGCIIASRWSELGWNAPTGVLPQTFGAVIPHEIPSELRQLAANAYKDAHAIHTYTYDGIITGVSVRPASNPDDVTFIPTAQERIGVYPDPGEESYTQITICADERITTSMRTLASSGRKSQLPVFSSLELPLPPQFNKVTDLTLLSVLSASLPLAAGLRYLTAKSIIENSPNPAIMVLELRNKPQLVTVQRMVQDRRVTDGRVPLVEWVARKLNSIYVTDGTEAVCRALQGGPDLTDVKQKLVDALILVGVEDELLDAVRVQCDAPKSRVILYNGKVVQRTPNGLIGGASTTRPLSYKIANFTWDVTEELVDSKGSVWYRCDLHLPNVTTPVSVEFKDIDFNNSSAFGRGISRELAKRNISNRTVMYNHSGFNLPEIRDALKTTVDVVQEVEQLGADANLDVHLPGCIITSGGTKLVAQTRILSMDPKVLGQYKGLDHRTKSSTHMKPILDLWSSSSIMEAALALGISHVAYCIAQDLICKRDGIDPPTQHLCLMDPMASTWLPVCAQLAMIFSGSRKLVIMPESQGQRYGAYMDKMCGLGSLPWFTELPNLRPSVFRDFVRQSPVSIIGIGDSSQGETLNGISSVSFISLDRAPLERPGYLTPTQLTGIREAMPEFIQAIIAATCDSTSADWRSATPALAMYYGVANMFDQFGVIERAPVDMLIREHYVPYNTTALNYLYRGLRDVFHYEKRNHTYVRVYGEPTEGSTAAAYIMDDVVLIDKAVATTIGRLHWSSGITPSLGGITQALRKAGHIVDVAPGRYPIDMDRFWAIPRLEWEGRVTGSIFKPGTKIKVPESTDLRLKIVS